MELKDVLGEIEADGAHLVHGRLLAWALTPPLWHADAVGGVHTIRPASSPSLIRRGRYSSISRCRSWTSGPTRTSCARGTAPPGLACFWRASPAPTR